MVPFAVVKAGITDNSLPSLDKSVSFKRKEKRKRALSTCLLTRQDLGRLANWCSETESV